MHQYFIKTPWLIKKLYTQYVWELPNKNNEVFLTFDDGPHPEITPWVLDLLKKYDAKATFFCIGSNVVQYPHIYQQLLTDGHQVGNHTQDHLNGWQTPATAYVQNSMKAAQYITTNLFRPPYGRIKRKQAALLNKAMQTDMKIIMWDVLSADFDKTISKEECVTNVTRNIQPGSIVVFHDSEKAFSNLQYALPIVLKMLEERKWRSKGIYL